MRAPRGAWCSRTPRARSRSSRWTTRTSGRGWSRSPWRTRSPARARSPSCAGGASGLLDSYPGTVRQVRSGPHGLSRTHLLTLDVATGADGLGASEVVVADGMVVGLLTGRAGDTFAAIASPVLARFVEDVASGTWRGFARGGFAWQNLTNPALRESLGLEPGETGVRLTRVLPHGTRRRGAAGGRRDPRGRRDPDRPHRALRAPALRADALRAPLLRRPSPRGHHRHQDPPRRRAPDGGRPAARDRGRGGQGSSLRLRARTELRRRGRARLPGAHRSLPVDLRRLAATGAAAAPHRLRPRGRPSPRRRARASSCSRACSPTPPTSGTRACAT